MGGRSSQICLDSIRMVSPIEVRKLNKIYSSSNLPFKVKGATPESPPVPTTFPHHVSCFSLPPLPLQAPTWGSAKTCLILHSKSSSFTLSCTFYPHPRQVSGTLVSMHVHGCSPTCSISPTRLCVCGPTFPTYPASTCCPDCGFLTFL